MVHGLSAVYVSAVYETLGWTGADAADVAGMFVHNLFFYA